MTTYQHETVDGSGISGGPTILLSHGFPTSSNLPNAGCGERGGNL